MESEINCDCGRWSGTRCAWSGPKSETVVVEFMPEWLRRVHPSSHECGWYPTNGAVRIRVERNCAAAMLEYDGEWCSIVEVA